MDESYGVGDERMRAVALEEGLRACFSLDSLRLTMLNQAVEWICDLTDLSLMEIRRELAHQKGGQVARSLATINAVKSLLKDGAKQQNPS
jgi:hypothetical protein